ncbi:hypothetical protein GDO81_019343, partial [Engystomops pustulosus]
CSVKCSRSPQCYHPGIQAVRNDCDSVYPLSRPHCGPPGVTADQCKQIGCCFDNTVEWMPWCFQPLIRKETIQCAVMSTRRVDCGFFGINKEQCYLKGCCYDSSYPNAPWCFYPDITE